MMFKFLSKTAPIIFAVLVTGICSNAAQAQNNQLLKQVEQYGQESQNNQNNNLGQVTNVNQLRDVAPTD
ncbi:MAG: hypothetical protein RLZZ574_2490, partial [Cyanobacteriota bacterium]